MHFIYKWLKKCRFLTVRVGHPLARLLEEPRGKLRANLRGETARQAAHQADDKLRPRGAVVDLRKAVEDEPDARRLDQRVLLRLHPV
eukprot:COSAG06_NODE_1302_length_9933_cov_7.954342_1_plen_87_part_00